MKSFLLLAFISIGHCLYAQSGFSKNDPAKAVLAAIINWYNDAPHEAILMAMNAAVKKPEDVLLLNDPTALLSIGGASGACTSYITGAGRKYGSKERNR